MFRIKTLFKPKTIYNNLDFNQDTLCVSFPLAGVMASIQLVSLMTM